MRRPGAALAWVLGLVVVAPPRVHAEAGWVREVGGVWGLDFVHSNGATGRRYMPETLGGGVVVLDYDLDGDWDVFFVDSGPLPTDPAAPGRSSLRRNDGGGRFVDVTARAGLRIAGYLQGGTVGDVDGDGDGDLYLTAVGPDALWINQGDGTFRDGTATAGLGVGGWSASAAFGDVDGDGDADLYVTRYVDFTLAAHRDCVRGDGIPGYCMPDAYDALHDRFYRNLGDGRFVDETGAAGLLPPRPLPGLGVAIADLTGDELLDVLVANDSQANFLFRNRGDGTFEEIGLVAGVAYGEGGGPEASMGIALGDVDGDADLDVVMTHFELETNALYAQAAGGVFRDVRFPAGIAEGSYASLAFGVVLADLDLDGDLDLAVANGHIQDTAGLLHERSTFAQRNQLWENQGAGRFREVVSSGLDGVRVSRGLAAGDLDLDGDPDLVCLANGAAAEVYETLAPVGASWLAVDLGGAPAEAGPVGARAIVRAPVAAGRPVAQRREVVGGGSYLSRSAPTLHFGLGGARSAQVEVRWPGGGRRIYRELPADRRLRLP